MIKKIVILVLVLFLGKFDSFSQDSSCKHTDLYHLIFEKMDLYKKPLLILKLVIDLVILL